MTAWLTPDSFDDFVARRHTALLRFAHVLAGDPHTAADLVQDALVRAGMSWHRILRQEDPEAYLRRTIVNLNLNRWRRTRRERLMDSVPDAGRDDPPTRDDAVWAALGRLPRAQRTVLVLRFYEDMSQAQIAAVMGCSVGTVKSNTARAMDQLKTFLDTDAPAGTGRRSGRPKGVVA